jgi:hypothetical protein
MKKEDLDKEFEELKVLNKELASLLEETAIPGSQAYFDMLFLEFANIVEKLEENGVPHEDLLSLCRDVTSKIDQQKLQKINSFYENFIKFGKKTKTVN